MNNKERVALFISIRNKMGGAERRLPRLFAGISQENVRATIIILQMCHNEEIKNKFKNLINEKTEILFFTNLFSVFMHILRERYNWICCFSPGFRNVIVFTAAWVSGTKRLFTSVSCYTSELIFESFMKKVRFYCMVYLSNRIDCLYPSSTPKLQKTFPKKKITTTPGAFTDLKKFIPEANKENLIVFASRMVEGKNPDIMAEAICIIQEKLRLYGYRCVLCGDGPELDKTIGILKNGKCLDLVDVPGDVKMDVIFPKAKIFCSLQSITNYPSQSLLEAMACGCYCIATDCGDTHLMINDAFGKLIKKNPNSLGNALLDAINFHEEKWRSISSSARNFIQQTYTLDISVQHYIGLFD